MINWALAVISIILLVGVVGSQELWFVELTKQLNIDQTAPNLVKQFGDMGLLLLPTAGISLLLFTFANFWLPRAGDNRFDGWRRTMIIRLIGLRWFFVCCALVLGLMLFWVDSAEEWGIVNAPRDLVKFSSLIHEHYLDRLR